MMAAGEREGSEVGGVSGGQPLVAHEVAELVAAEVDRTAVVLGCGRQRRNGGGWSAQVEMAQRARWGESCARGLMDWWRLARGVGDRPRRAVVAYPVVERELRAALSLEVCG